MKDPFTGQIIGHCIEIQGELGVGLPERIYEQALEIALLEDGFFVERQVPVAFSFRGQPLLARGIADMRVQQEDRCVDLELKSALAIHSMHEGQALAYARFDPLVEGCLLINFGEVPLGIKRFAGPTGWKTPTG